MRKPCKIDGCDNPSAGRGWCQKHWTRWRKHGEVKDRFPSALCRQTERDLWFPKEGDRWTAEAAIRICHTCPHISDCLRFALSMSDNPEGIWGGMTRRQRAALRR